MTKRRRVVLLTLLALAEALVVAAAGLAGAGMYWATLPDPRLRAGRRAVHKGDFQEAQHLSDLLEADGELDRAHLLRGDLLLARARVFLDTDSHSSIGLELTEQAHDQLNLIRASGALRLEAAALDGQCLYYLGSPAEAERALTWVVSEQPDQVDAHRMLAALYYDQGAMPEAIVHLEKVALLDPQDWRPHRLLGLIYKDRDRNEKAVASYRRALECRMSAASADEVRAELGEVLVQIGEYTDAQHTLEACTAQTISRPDVQALLAECLLATGPNQTAGQDFLDHALAQHPNAVSLLRLRARLHRDAHEPEAAAALFKRAVESDPYDYPTLIQYAQLLDVLKDHAGAVEQHRRADEIRVLRDQMARLLEQAQHDPWDAGVRRRLAELCLKLNRPDLAQNWSKAAVACEQHARVASPGS